MSVRVEADALAQSTLGGEVLHDLTVGVAAHRLVPRLHPLRFGIDGRRSTHDRLEWGSPGQHVRNPTHEDAQPLFAAGLRRDVRANLGALKTLLEHKD